MKNRFKKKNKERSSLAVIRAVTRINEHFNRQASRSVVWDRKIITELSITS